MHLKDIDLNLLRLFDAVYRTRNVSRAAELLDLTQPAASQGLSRLRTLIHDPLFMRSAGGVQPTPRRSGLPSRSGRHSPCWSRRSARRPVSCRRSPAAPSTST